MLIKPITPLSPDWYTCPLDHQRSMLSDHLPVNLQQHSLSWLTRHHPLAAAYLRDQLENLQQLEKKQSQPPVDQWIHHSPDQNLQTDPLAIDRFEKRNLISETVEHQIPIQDEHQQPWVETIAPPVTPTLDDRLVPAGIMGITIMQTPSPPPVKTGRLSCGKPKAAGSLGWMLRVSVLVLLCLLFEGLLAKWLLG
ncbi:MAG: hypothetical protein JKX85_13280 [Phycisphaeraceae bacterium]|nr:hypothetical protein [Phycisphaeraceae bacterium]